MKETTQTEAGKRVLLYDWLRIIATLWVIIGHSVFIQDSLTHGQDLSAVLPSLSLAYNGSFLSFCRFLSGWVYIFHMPLFFAISGAVLALKPLPSFDDFLRSKAKRLLIPYFACGLLFMLPVKLLAGVYSPGEFPSVIREFLSGNEDINAHLWFLPALFWLMILFSVFEKTLKRLKIHSLYLLLIPAALVSLTYQHLPFDFFFLKRGLDYMVYFTFGYVFEHERRRIRPMKTGTAAGIFVILMLLEALYKKYLILNNFSGLVCGCMLSYVIALLCSRFFAGFTGTRIWKILIRNLFAVYLFHDPLEYVTAAVFIRGGLLSHAFGCYLYTFMRMLGVGILSVVIAGLLRYCLRKLQSLFDKNF